MALLDNRHPDRADMGGGADVYERWGSGMTEQEREELIKQIATAIAVHAQDSEDGWWIWEPEARAALAVAEPILREQCAGAYLEETMDGWQLRRKISAAIREGGKDD